jgi:HAD superfamily hydrolase (TIGR01509 family)
LERIEALILDFDGLILDTETPAYESWKRLYQRFGVDLPFEEWAVCVGRGMVFDPHAHLEKLTGRTLEREAIRIERQGEVRKAVESQPLLPGVQQIFDEAVLLRLRLGVASSSPRNWVEGHLRRLHLFSRLETVKCAEDVTHTKPDPELFLSTLSDLGIRASEAVVFEDSPNGVIAANRAGIYCVVATNPITSRLSFNGARIDLRVNSLSEIDLPSLLLRLEGGKSSPGSGRYQT